jgi:hypothetical protein
MNKTANFLTKEEFTTIADNYKNRGDIHWLTNVNNHRWEYHEKVIDLLKTIEFDSVLEAGTMNIKIYSDSDTIDYNLPNSGWYLYYTPTHIHDLRQIPWCIDDKKYDVFIALRVFHHLLDKPQKYFNEMKRISNHIILALPDNVAEIYKKIQSPTLELICLYTDTVILYYKI